MQGGQSTRLPDLPERLTELTEGYTVSRYPWYETAAKIYRLESESEAVYLKLIEGQPTRSLERESKILEWIDGRIPTPNLLYYTYENEIEYQLTSEVKGTPTYKVQPFEKADAVRVLGETLKMIHSLGTDGCPIDNRIDNKLALIEDSSKLGDKPVEELVFTHGDYCLPNIIMENAALSGVIDWDYGGLADPYVDFNSCIWSMGYNYGEQETKQKWTPLFLESYGLDDLDEEKLAFYGRLSSLIE
jgi:aminoglycoside phosphotransferase